ncbi:MAG: tRNA (guanosine(46)-N7)-methyltransferase TrmB [Cardiobacteriaceae bacterium]|nr:tRNA (guanosine(46)-N7)-methyltransferase TrmB [Cardiobacteriaceae bacterium]
MTVNHQLTPVPELSEPQPIKARAIKSFVLRQGRMTDAQERAYEEQWALYGIDFAPQQSALSLPLNFSHYFGSDKPLVVEIGFGMGDSLVEMAQKHPETHFVGIEVHKPGVGRALMNSAKAGLKNIRFLRHDAVEVLELGIADGSLSRVQIYFPDPWHKARHHKRRLIQAPFLSLLHRKLQAGGELHIATDWEHYAEWIRDLLRDNPQWHNLGNPDGYSERPNHRPETKFERRGLKLGHGVWDLRYTKIPTPSSKS